MLFPANALGVAIANPCAAPGRKFHIIKYEPIVNSPILHHGVVYNCLPSDELAVEALPNLGPYNGLKQGMLCEQFFMVDCPLQADTVALPGLFGN